MSECEGCDELERIHGKQYRWKHDHTMMNHMKAERQAHAYVEDENERLYEENEKLRDALIEASSWITDRKEQKRVLALLDVTG